MHICQWILFSILKIQQKRWTAVVYRLPQSVCMEIYNWPHFMLWGRLNILCKLHIFRQIDTWKVMWSVSYQPPLLPRKFLGTHCRLSQLKKDCLIEDLNTKQVLATALSRLFQNEQLYYNFLATGQLFLNVKFSGFNFVRKLACRLPAKKDM